MVELDKRYRSLSLNGEDMMGGGTCGIKARGREHVYILHKIYVRGFWYQRS